MTPSLPPLPVVEALPALRAALAAGSSAVLAAPPGSGKTTVIPLALLNEPWLNGQRILMLEPRRIAARAAAQRMASLLGEAVGETVGYQIRFERKVSTRTRIEVVTEGLLARRIQADPELPGVGLVIFDEFHERALSADLALALTLDARATLIPRLRVLVMSATLDTARVSSLLGDAPLVESGGRLFEVDIRHLAPRAGAEQAEAVAQGVWQALQETQGDILAFLPGAREIRRAQSALQARGGTELAVCPLYGELSSAEQDAALRPDPQRRRKVILATNIAQTSLTVEGVSTVVDGGWVRVARFDLGAGADRLDTERVSRASAEQRAGRAGRLGPGVCYRLWSREQHASLAAHDTPEMLAVDLTRFALELAAWGVKDPAQLALLDPPPATLWSYARERLRELAAINDDGRITEHGRALVRLPLPPRRGHMLLRAAEQGLGGLAAWVAAVLDERPRGSNDLVQLVQGYLSGRAEPAAQRRVRETVRQLARLVDAGDPSAGAEAELARIVAWGYPERVALRRTGVRGVREVAYLCADGGEARLLESDPLAQAEYLAIAHWEPGPPRRISLAVPLAEADLRRDHADFIAAVEEIRWDAATEAVIAERQTRFGALILDRKPHRSDGEAIARAMLAGVRALGVQALPWTESARQWCARVMSVRLWRPEEDWPDLSDEGLLAGLEHWLLPYLGGCTRREHLGRLNLTTLLQAQLDYAAQQRLNRLAPTHIEVPTGSRIALEYQPPLPPALSVKLQEMFGSATTPTVDDGRVPVQLHLLSPAQRPLAVTQDLAGFWARGYADVKKDGKGRYPRHPWPDDPLAAPPSRRAKPRGT